MQPCPLFIQPADPSPRREAPVLPLRGMPFSFISSWDWKPGCLGPCFEPLCGTLKGYPEGWHVQSTALVKRAQLSPGRMFLVSIDTRGLSPGFTEQKWAERSAITCKVLRWRVQNLGSEPRGPVSRALTLHPYSLEPRAGLRRRLLSEEMKEATDGLLACGPTAHQLGVSRQIACVAPRPHLSKGSWLRTPFLAEAGAGRHPHLGDPEPSDLVSWQRGGCGDGWEVDCVGSGGRWRAQRVPAASHSLTPGGGVSQLLLVTGQGRSSNNIPRTPTPPTRTHPGSSLATAQQGGVSLNSPNRVQNPASLVRPESLAHSEPTAVGRIVDPSDGPGMICGQEEALVFMGRRTA